MTKLFFIFFSVLFSFLVVSAVVVRYTNGQQDKREYVRNSYKAFKAGEISKAQYNENCISVGLDCWVVE